MAAESKLNLVRDFPRNLALHNQQAFQFAVISPRPDVCLIVHSNQLGGDANVLRIAAHSALKQVLDSEFTADLFQRRRAVLVMHDRCTGDHPQALGVEIPHLRNHLFGQTVAEVVLRGIAGEVVEWEHGEHGSSRECLGTAQGSEPTNIRASDYGYDDRNAEDSPKS